MNDKFECLERMRRLIDSSLGTYYNPCGVVKMVKGTDTIPEGEKVQEKRDKYNNGMALTFNFK